MRKFLGERTPGAIAVVARRGGEAVGWVAVTPLCSLRPAGAPRNPNVDRIFIVNVFVSPQARRSGVGKRLGQAAIREARGVRSDAIVVAGARLDVGDEEAAGLALYRALGMREGEMIKDKSGRTAREFFLTGR